MYRSGPVTLRICVIVLILYSATLSAREIYLRPSGDYRWKVTSKSGETDVSLTWIHFKRKRERNRKNERDKYKSDSMVYNVD